MVGARNRCWVDAQAASQTDEKRRILIVDDDRGFLELAERLLVKEGFNVLSTDNPKGALQLARAARPDLVLLDILMPDFDGWAVLESAQAGPGHGYGAGGDLEYRGREEAGPRRGCAMP